MGKPGEMNSRYSPLNKIGGYEPTQGSEPSPYLEEEKTIVIPIVVASEIGRAQTRSILGWSGGCRTA